MGDRIGTMANTELDKLVLYRNAFLGGARLPLGCISFDKYGPGIRFFKPQDMKKSREILQADCLPQNIKNRIHISISTEDLEDILRRSDLSRNSLSVTNPPLLSVNPDKPLQAVHGYPCWMAAKSCFKESTEQPWAVALIQDGSKLERPMSSGQV
jgi:hypothetical protein